jgi:hypothetical protein
MQSKFKDFDIELIFTSTTGRSGTRYLSNIVNINSTNATSEHDPYPRGFGNPIIWYDNNETDKLKKLVEYKLKRLIRGRKYNKMFSLPIVNKMIGRKKSKSKFYLRTHRRLRKYIPSVEIKNIYLESTHSFIKSFGEELYKLKSDIKLIHLTRNPLEVAKSLLNRNSIPGPNNIYLLNPEFKKNELKIIHKLSNYQKCLW